MKQKSVPGYSLLSGKPNYSYEPTLRDISSPSIISIAITINNELEADIPYKEDQNRIPAMTKRDIRKNKFCGVVGVQVLGLFQISSLQRRPILFTFNNSSYTSQRLFLDY